MYYHFRMFLCPTALLQIRTLHVFTLCIYLYFDKEFFYEQNMHSTLLYSMHFIALYVAIIKDIKS